MFSWFAESSGRPSPGDSEVRRLETEAMRRWLARRRWVRACHIIRATIRLNSFSLYQPDSRPDYLSSEEIWI